MKTILFFIAIIIANSAFSQAPAEKILVEVGKLNTAEYNVLNSIGNKDFGKLELTKDVKRYYKLVNGTKQYVLNELIYKTVEGFIGDGYIAYEVTFTGDEYNMNINYNYSVGTAYTSTGTVIKLGDTLVQTDISWGTTASTTTMLINNKIVHEQTKNL